MVKKIAIEERKKISQWAEAMEALSKYDPRGEMNIDITFYAKIIESNTFLNMYG